MELILIFAVARASLKGPDRKVHESIRDVVDGVEDHKSRTNGWPEAEEPHGALYGEIVGTGALTALVIFDRLHSGVGGLGNTLVRKHCTIHMVVQYSKEIVEHVNTRLLYSIFVIQLSANTPKTRKVVIALTNRTWWKYAVSKDIPVRADEFSVIIDATIQCEMLR